MFSSIVINIKSHFSNEQRPDVHSQTSTSQFNGRESKLNLHSDFQARDDRGWCAACNAKVIRKALMVRLLCQSVFKSAF